MPPPEKPSAIAVAHKQLLNAPASSQPDCGLLRLPTEIRFIIYGLALATYEDPDPEKKYPPRKGRPGYFAPRRTDAALLRTCKAIYRECWALPFALTEITIGTEIMFGGQPESSRPYVLTCSAQITNPGTYGPRRPRDELTRLLEDVARWRGRESMTLGKVRIFPEMWRLELGFVKNWLSTPLLHPGAVAFAIPYETWHMWAYGRRPELEGHWIIETGSCMSGSVDTVSMELETITRKKDQMDDIAEEMKRKWFFKRSDGLVLFADQKEENEVTYWRRPTEWMNTEWEGEGGPPTAIDFCIVTVTFRLRSVIEKKGGYVSPLAKSLSQKETVERDVLRIQAKDGGWGEKPLGRFIDDPSPSWLKGQYSRGVFFSYGINTS